MQNNLLIKKALVVKSTGSWYEIVADKKRIKCRIKGKFRLQGLKLTNPVAVGDVVDIELDDKDETQGIIKKIHDRKNYIVRQSPRKKHFLHLLASNLDQAVLIITINYPKLKQGFIDRFLLMTEPYNIPVTIVFNKSDLYEEGDNNLYFHLKNVYEKIGHRCMLSSALTGDGIDELKSVLKNNTSIIAGQSGVGKSSIVNSIYPDLNLKTNELSNYTGKGQHTSTFAEMFELESGTKIIDTPGIKNLSFNNLEVLDVAHNFREFFEKSKFCKYSNCTHRNEPKCAVKEAIENQEISELRYFNYIQILEEIEDQNYWERHKM